MQSLVLQTYLTAISHACETAKQAIVLTVGLMNHGTLVSALFKSTFEQLFPEIDRKHWETRYYKRNIKAITIKHNGYRKPWYNQWC